MTRNAKRGRKKRKANRGSFQKGFDPRRHVFTAQDCRIGYWVAAIKHPELREWLLRLQSSIAAARERGEGLVLSCSALKRDYRQLLSAGAIRSSHLWPADWPSNCR